MYVLFLQNPISEHVRSSWESSIGKMHNIFVLKTDRLIDRGLSLRVGEGVVR